MNMNAEYERQLEAVVQDELDGLGELEAPPEIARRVMRVIAQRTALPWYRREWQTWPLVLRTGSLAGLAAAFACLCYETSQLASFATLTPAAREMIGWFSQANAAWNAVNAVVTPWNWPSGASARQCSSAARCYCCSAMLRAWD